MTPRGNGRFDAVMFDFGGVLVSSPFEALRAFAGSLDMPLSIDELFDEVFGPYHIDTDHPWHRVERGELGFMEYFDGLSARLAAREVHLDLGGFAQAFGGLTPQPLVVECVVEVKSAGYATAMVTNNIAEGRDHWAANAPLDHFDVVIDSSAVGMRKPAAPIYHLALERLGGLAPARAVFLDDAPGNIEGARSVGMEAVLVEGDGSDAVSRLRSLLDL